jgi:hypothetical protein
LNEVNEIFPDSCLGIHIAEVVCTQLETRGTSIRLEAGDIIYEFHSAEDPVNPQLAEVGGHNTSIAILNWSRRGGREEYCDTLVFYLTGRVIQYNCKESAGREPGILRLSPQDQRRLLEWFLELQAFEYEQTSATGVLQELIFLGFGIRSASFDQQQEMLALASDLLLPVSLGTNTPLPETQSP